MKLEYTTLFEEYTHAVERMIESAITAKVPVSLSVVIISALGNDAIPYRTFVRVSPWPNWNNY